MAMREDWITAKQDSEAKFGQAYKAWFDRIFALDRSGDKKAQQKVAMEQLKRTGLDKGPKFTSYCSFKPDFPAALAKVEAMATASAAATKRQMALTLDDVLKSTKLNAILKKFCEKTHAGEIYAFVTVGAKKPPKFIYETFIKDGAKLKLNIDDAVFNQWKAWNASNNWTQAGKSIADLLDMQQSYLKDNFDKCYRSVDYKPLIRKELGAADPAATRKAAEKCLETAFKHMRELQGFAKRWVEMKPKIDFWTKPMETLEAIMAKLVEIKNKS